MRTPQASGTIAFLLALAVASPWVANAGSIMLIDGYADGTIYNEHRRGGRGTNVDDLTPVLALIPDIVVDAELVHPSWERHEQVRRRHPDVIVVHLSAFRGDRRDTTEASRQLIRLFESLRGTSTRFVVYSRLEGLESDRALHRRLFLALARPGEVSDHIRFLQVPWPQTFPDAATASSFQSLCRAILAQVEEDPANE